MYVLHDRVRQRGRAALGVSRPSLQVVLSYRAQRDCKLSALAHPRPPVLVWALNHCILFARLAPVLLGRVLEQRRRLCPHCIVPSSVPLCYDGYELVVEPRLGLAVLKERRGGTSSRGVVPRHRGEGADELRGDAAICTHPAGDNREKSFCQAEVGKKLRGVSDTTCKTAAGRSGRQVRRVWWFGHATHARPMY